MKWLWLVLLIPMALGGQAHAYSVVASQSDSLPADPVRVVTLDDLSTELVVSLGIEPVGVANLSSYRQWVQLGNEYLEGSVDLGSSQQPNLERLVRLEPDLILGVSSLHAVLFERLDALAPTLLYNLSLEPGPPDAVERGSLALSHLAGITGRESRADQVLEDLESALAEAQELARETGVSKQPLAILYPLIQQGLFIVSNEQTLIVSIANRLGGSNPWPLREPHSIHRRIGIHELADRPNLNVLFIGGFAEAPLFDSSLWKALPVGDHRHHGFLETPYWSFGGPRSATVMTREMTTLLKHFDAQGRSTSEASAP